MFYLASATETGFVVNADPDAHKVATANSAGSCPGKIRPVWTEQLARPVIPGGYRGARSVTG
jgi:hypothetical protein